MVTSSRMFLRSLGQSQPLIEAQLTVWILVNVRLELVKVGYARALCELKKVRRDFELGERTIPSCFIYSRTGTLFINLYQIGPLMYQT